MWHTEHSATTLALDSEKFIAVLNAQQNFFAASAPVFVARAPGRLDLMGGIADYSGALVLELPLSVSTFAAVQPTNDAVITVMSTATSEIVHKAVISFATETLLPVGKPLDYAVAQTFLTSDPQHTWAAYIVGVLIVLQRECGLVLERGIHIFVHCDVPIGKGVSSSAALEVAVMQAVCAAYDIDINGRTMALLCQCVENLIVGAPCGVMDQMTAACGEQDALLALLCQPAELLTPVPLPKEVEVWGIDSGIRHAVTGADYGAVRIGAFMGYRIIADLLGLPVKQQTDGVVDIADTTWHGYLANIEPSLWETLYRDRVPIQMNGDTFLTRYGGFTDTVTQVDYKRTYAVRQPTAHPIYEHHRVRLFARLLQTQPMIEETLILLGELMYQSHASYSACGLGADGTDRLVELIRTAGPASGLYGAKITGGGSGGTVAVLARHGREETIQAIAQRYADETGRAITVLGGSSPGAIVWGSMRLVYE